MSDQRPERVWVCGLSGSGKTTVARHLARILRVPHVELDALHWRHRPDWGMPSDEEFLPDVRQATAGDAWVVEGNYSRSRDIYLASSAADGLAGPAAAHGHLAGISAARCSASGAVIGSSGACSARLLAMRCCPATAWCSGI